MGQWIVSKPDNFWIIRQVRGNQLLAMCNQFTSWKKNLVDQVLALKFTRIV